jgi:serine O-acetyltransferase
MNYRKRIETYFQETLDTLYPVRTGNTFEQHSSIEHLQAELLAILMLNIESTSLDIKAVAKAFTEDLLLIKNKLNKDVEALYLGDPAAINHNEIIIAYPGFYAIAAYRIANYLLKKGVPLIPRIIAEHAHSYTGIDIHPAATIGDYLCIDHGTGVVIGETAVLGNHIKIYQGVTLGALSIPDKTVKGQRHPTIKDNVVIYAQATILGGDTVIGENSIIGGNVWITRSIPANTKVYYKQHDNIEIKQDN